MEYNEYYQKIRKYAQKALNGDLKTYLAGRSKYTYGTIDLSEYVKESVFEETTGKINDALDQEIEDRTNADTQINSALDQEIEDRTNADTQINSALDQEIEDRTNADTQINDSLDSLEKRVLTNENNIESLETSKLNNLTAGTGIDITNNIVSCTLDTEVFKIVESLPTADINDNVIYVVPSETTGEYNKYIEYIYVNNEWEKVGEFTASLDLDDYYTKEEVNDIIENDVVTDVWTGGVSPISLEYTRDGGLVNITASIDLTEINEKINAKLDKLTAGDNITITNNVISATGSAASDTFNMGVGPKEVTSQSTHTNLIWDTQFKGNTGEWSFGSYTEILEKKYCGNNVFYCSNNVHDTLEFLLYSTWQVNLSTHTFSFWSKGSVNIYMHYATNVVADGELINEGGSATVTLNDEDWTFHTITFNDGGFLFNPTFSYASDFYFSMPKLEEGGTATVFTENISDYVTESDIDNKQDKLQYYSESNNYSLLNAEMTNINSPLAYILSNSGSDTAEVDIRISKEGSITSRFHLKPHYTEITGPKVQISATEDKAYYNDSEIATVDDLAEISTKVDSSIITYPKDISELGFSNDNLVDYTFASWDSTNCSFSGGTVQGAGLYSAAMSSSSTLSTTISVDTGLKESWFTFSFYASASNDCTFYIAPSYLDECIVDGSETRTVTIDSSKAIPVTINTSNSTFHVVLFKVNNTSLMPNSLTLLLVASNNLTVGGVKLEIGKYVTVPRSNEIDLLSDKVDSLSDSVTNLSTTVTNLSDINVSERNLLLNPQFDGFDNWTITGAASVASEKFNGWKVADICFEYPRGCIQLTISISEGKYYKFSCWAKSDGVGKVMITNSSLQTIYSENNNYTGKDWSLITIIMKATSTTSSSITIENYPSSSSAISDVYVSMPVLEDITEISLISGVDDKLEYYREKYADTLLDNISACFTGSYDLKGATIMDVDTSGPVGTCRIRVYCLEAYHTTIGEYVTWQDIVVAVSNYTSDYNGTGYVAFDLLFNIVDDEIQFPRSIYTINHIY